MLVVISIGPGLKGSQGMKITPRNNQVLVKRIEEEKVGLLEVPDSAKDKPQKGTVESFGEAVTGLKEGDKVLYRKYAGDEFPGDDTLLLMSEDEIIAKVED